MTRPASHLRERLADALFWAGLALCGVLLVPVCALLWLVRGVFVAVDWCSSRLKKA